jgi:hypothetical protein
MDIIVETYEFETATETKKVNRWQHYQSGQHSLSGSVFRLAENDSGAEFESLSDLISHLQSVYGLGPASTTSKLTKTWHDPAVRF